VTASENILARIRSGQAVILSADAASSLRSAGVGLDGSAPLGRLVREKPAVVLQHYEREVVAGVEVMCALTAETMPRALALAGMAFRAAALTGSAIEMALDATSHASRPVAVAGLLGGRTGAPLAADRVAEECAMHAARLAAAGCEIILACSVGPFASKLGRISAIISASTLRLPTWALVEVHGERTSDGEDLEECAKSVVASGAQLMLFDVASEREAADALDRTAGSLGEAKAGVILADPAGDADAWAEAAKRLAASGAHVLGGGAGTTAEHLAALSAILHRRRSTSLRPTPREP
jgi:S-methylmethionine-dependent homocysteine/selenocysteine methylase